PADVLCACGAAIAPPGVVLAARVQRAIRVDPAGIAIAKSVEPVALGREATGILLVRRPVADVETTAHDVPVAADDVITTTREPAVEHRLEPLHHLELEALPFLAGRAR